MLTQARLKERLHYDATTGVFTWSSMPVRGMRVGVIAGTPHSRGGYRNITIDGRKYFAHRIAWLYIHGAWPEAGLDIDHIDGDKSNNAIANLRAVTRQVNMQNQKRAHANSKTGFIGVSVNTTGYDAKIMINKVPLYIGHFPTPELAHAAYLAVKRSHHPGNTL